MKLETSPYTYVVMEENKAIDSGQSAMTSRSFIECNLGEVGKVSAVYNALAFCTLGYTGRTKSQISESL